MKRYLHDVIGTDLNRKMVFLTGPRQVGKTYLARDLMQGFQRPQYLNYDAPDDIRVIHERTWSASADLLVFDEIHKMSDWKSYLKGVFDTRPAHQSILVTGSARLDTYRQSGESLAGRYYHVRLHPLSVRELHDRMTPAAALEALNRLGGFPEPFLSGSEQEAARWRNQYYTDLVREDILEFSRIHEIRAIRLMLEMLRIRVGSPLSFTSLAGDLQVAPNTLRKYVDILESLHIVFLVRPWHRNVARAILKEPKLYFFDTGLVKGDDGIRLENTCAAALLKHVDFLHDVRGEPVSLHYIRDKEGHETDFALANNEELDALIEIKKSEAKPAPGLQYFAGRLCPPRCIQLVQDLRQEQQTGSIRILDAARWLSELDA